MSEQNDPKKNRIGRPQRYLFQKDWDAFVNKEWNPFKYNDLPHLLRDVAWLKILTMGILLAIVGCAFAIIISK